VFVAIAQGQLPQESWFALGRLLTSAGGEPILLSWSGSMFEYLMPQLVMPNYEHTLLDQTMRAAVARQIEYGQQLGLPWGMSESGYNTVDLHLNYQYRAFGVPGLGLKRGLADDLVVAPYASGDGADGGDRRRPARTCNAFPTSARKGSTASLNPSTTRRSASNGAVKPIALVLACMAHHQGMSLLALAMDCCWIGRCPETLRSRSPSCKSALLLLQERIPRASEFDIPHFPERQRSPGHGAVSPEITDPGVERPRYADTGSAVALQRPLSRHGHPGGRRLQPLERPGRDALARGRRARPLGHVHLSARRGKRRDLVHGAPAHAAARRTLRSDLFRRPCRIPSP
jgi:hypothetical protein